MRKNSVVLLFCLGGCVDLTLPPPLREATVLPDDPTTQMMMDAPSTSDVEVEYSGQDAGIPDIDAADPEEPDSAIEPDAIEEPDVSITIDSALQEDSTLEPDTSGPIDTISQASDAPIHPDTQAVPDTATNQDTAPKPDVMADSTRDMSVDTKETQMLRINFQPPTTPIPAGYLADTGQIFGDRGNGFTYGWNMSHTDTVFDRSIHPDKRLDTFCALHVGAKWELLVPKSTLRILVSIGDPGSSSTHVVRVEGATYWDGVTTAINEFATLSMTLTITDGRLTIDAPGSTERSTRINYIEISLVN